MRRIIFSVILLLSAGSLFCQKPATVLPVMVEVEGGSFRMGADSGRADEQPVRQVEVGTFNLGKFEVTFGEFRRFVNQTGYITDAGQPDSVRVKKGLPPGGSQTGTWCTYSTGLPVSPDDSLYPVGNISWNDAVAYCEWLSRETGRMYRLPTEAEWEYAARGGRKSRGFVYSGGNTLDEVGWYLMNARNKTHPVGEKTPNELGICDMTGNVREWCSDGYDPAAYTNASEKDYARSVAATERVMRGGMWRDEVSRMRTTSRFHEHPANHALGFGFRVAMTAR